MGRRLTYREIAALAGTSERTVSEWMRGATAPLAMNGALNLLARLSAEDVNQVLALWRQLMTEDRTSAATAASETH